MYPQDVAYPIGGGGNAQYVILEMHYDNPNEDIGEDIHMLHDDIITPCTTWYSFFQVLWIVLASNLHTHLSLRSTVLESLHQDILYTVA